MNRLRAPAANSGEKKMRLYSSGSCTISAWNATVRKCVHLTDLIIACVRQCSGWSRLLRRPQIEDTWPWGRVRHCHVTAAAPPADQLAEKSACNLFVCSPVLPPAGCCTVPVGIEDVTRGCHSHLSTNEDVQRSGVHGKPENGMYWI